MSQVVKFEEVEKYLKLGELDYFNIYNSDINPTSFFSAKYYLDHPHDTFDNPQIVKTLFIDIEFWSGNQIVKESDIDEASFPINAVTICDTEEKTFKALYLIIPEIKEKFGIVQDVDINQLTANYEAEFKQVMLRSGHITDDFNIQITLFDNENNLLIHLWELIHYSDPDILSGWNSDSFDFPYIYTRCCNLFGKDAVPSMFSKFNNITVRGKFISIPEYTILDLLYAYKPRDEGGLNLGKKRDRYTLENISRLELNVGKVEYKDSSGDLNTLYVDDPATFLLYNIVDVALVYFLDNKLKHIDLYNSIRRIMATSMSSSIMGSSVLFDTFVFYNLIKENKLVRYGMNNEIGRLIEPEELVHINKFIDKKGTKIEPPKIPAKTYSNLISRYPGAFVMVPKAKIINDGSLVIDFDAARLYPSMILQSNISFDSYRGRIIPPCTYKTLDVVKVILDTRQIPQNLSNNILKLSTDYVDREDVAKKKETSVLIYYVIFYLFNKLLQSQLTIEEIFAAQTTKSSLILRTILIPLLDLINIVHPANPGYNQFAYDYLFMNNEAKLTEKYPILYYIGEPGESNTFVNKISYDDFKQFIPNYSFTLAGTMFDKHEKNLGLFAGFLDNMYALRKKYKNARQECKKGSDDYLLNDSRQKSIKVIMNTTYGLYGLTSFRYSNHWLAQSITNNGVMTIKLSQFIAEQYLNYKYGQL